MVGAAFFFLGGRVEGAGAFLVENSGWGATRRRPKKNCPRKKGAMKYRCEGTTQGGTRCKHRKVLPHAALSYYCFSHASQRTAASETQRVDVPPHRPVPPKSTHPEKGDCAVCLECFEDTFEKVSLQCGHRYHSRCIKRWWRAQRTSSWSLLEATCPLCRHPFRLEEIVDDDYIPSDVARMHRSERIARLRRHVSFFDGSMRLRAIFRGLRRFLSET
jgi:hypothetical protein